MTSVGYQVSKEPEILINLVLISTICEELRTALGERAFWFSFTRYCAILDKNNRMTLSTKAEELPLHFSQSHQRPRYHSWMGPKDSINVYLIERPFLAPLYNIVQTGV